MLQKICWFSASFSWMIMVILNNACPFLFLFFEIHLVFNFSSYVRFHFSMQIFWIGAHDQLSTFSAN